MIQHRSELYKLLPANAHVAEIGVAEAYFSADILRWENVERLYMVDNWGEINGQKGDGGFPQDWHDKNFHDAITRVQGVNSGDRFVILMGLSAKMAVQVPDGSLDLVYLDADHSYEGVINDLIAWFPKVKHGGVIAGHDYVNAAYGVYSAVKDFTSGKYQVHLIPELKDEDSGFYFIKQ